MTTQLQTQPKTERSNEVICGACIRLQILHSHCIRIEYHPQGRFIDSPTLFARQRPDSRLDGCRVMRKDGELIIDTGAISLTVNQDADCPTPETMQARIRRDGQWLTWRPGDAKHGNLGGTAETLDGWNGPRPLPPGLLSRDGWFLLDDSNTPILTDDGWVDTRPDKTGLDWYLFGYGDDFRAAFQAFTAVSGPVPMPRRQTLGAWYSRYWPYSSDDYQRIVAEYDQHDFPLDVMVMDMDWHINDAGRAPGAKANADGQVWTGYTWDRDLLPDVEKLLDWLHTQGLLVTLNDHPADGVQPHEEMYKAFMAEMGKRHDDHQVIPFDAADRNYLETFYRHTHAPLERQGVDFWWLDWQQEKGTRSLPELTNLQWLNYYYYMQSAADGKRGQSFSRWAGWGDHRHPIHFSGDADTGWKMLAFEVPFTAAAGNVGCFFWSHDIGGHMGGRNEESYTRWCQFGAFSAALRSHSTRDKDMDRRPWTYPDWARDAMRRAFHLRSESFPYLYSCAAQACRDSYPMIRPMYLDHPQAEEAYCNPQQYMFGDHLLVAPITQPGLGKNRIAGQVVWFPQGRWYNVFTGECTDGPCERLVAAAIDEFPLYVRAGTTLPTQPYTPRMGSEPTNELILRCWPGVDAVQQQMELLEDDGQSKTYLDGERASTAIVSVQKVDTFTVAVGATEGSYDGQAETRRLRLLLHEVEQPSSAAINGAPVVPEYDPSTRIASLQVDCQDIRQACRIAITAVAANPERAAAEAFAKRTGIAPASKDESFPAMLGRALTAADATSQSLALLAAGIGLAPKHETAYGFPPEPEYFVFTPEPFDINPEITLQLGKDAQAKVRLHGEKTKVGLKALTARLVPPADELLFPSAPVELTATIQVAGQSLHSTQSVTFDKPCWEFTRNLAPAATITVSSYMDDQPADGAIDGVIDGIPGNRFAEWASCNEGTGAWLKLEWPEPVSVGRVLLFDRPNHADHILAGQIILDDGSVFAVGELPDNGKTPFELTFQPRSVRWLLFVVTAVSATTGWTGLSEIAVYGTDESIIKHSHREKTP